MGGTESKEADTEPVDGSSAGDEVVPKEMEQAVSQAYNDGVRDAMQSKGTDIAMEAYRTLDGAYHELEKLQDARFNDVKNLVSSVSGRLLAV
jgi:hypothetical protein